LSAVWPQKQGGKEAFMITAMLRTLSSDLLRCLRFYSRLPVPVLVWEENPHDVPDFDRLTRVLPFAALIIGAFGAAIAGLALLLQLGPWLATMLALTTLTFITCAFHEDGLADVADGFGGGHEPVRRLEIMKDSLIGAFGASALIAVYGLRLCAASTFLERTDMKAAMISFLIAAMLSRVLGLVPLALLPAARAGGFSAAVGRPSALSFSIACGLSLLLGVVLSLFAGIAIKAFALAVLMGAGIALYLTHLSHRLIQGQTGDVAGAVQQVSEAGIFIGLIIGTTL
jgi:adenosylcobinamide-GDP ribazoletransferase